MEAALDISEHEDPPLYHERMWDIVRELSARHKISDILEFGCGSGNFVRFLRNEGYNAFGIDMREKFMSETGISEGYLAVCSIENYHGRFGDISFDVVLANSVMSLDATIAAVTNLTEEHVLASNEYFEAWEINTHKILEVAHKSLREGGFFAAVELSGERLSPNIKGYASDLGYELVSHSPGEIMLQKRD